MNLYSSPPESIAGALLRIVPKSSMSTTLSNNPSLSAFFSLSSTVPFLAYSDLMTESTY